VNTSISIPLWQPSAARIADALVTRFMREQEARHGIALPDYASLWRWSIEQREAFWQSLWQHTDVIGDSGERVLIDGDRMPGARWFPDARLNFAENLLGRRSADDNSDAIVFRGEDKVSRRLSHAEVVAAVRRVASALQAQGVHTGDRVAGYLPNLPETIIAMLACASLGAIWSSCSPDFGVRGVLDRFSQIGPKVLFTVDGYWYNGKPVPIVDKVRDVVKDLPTVQQVVVVPYLALSGQAQAIGKLPNVIEWDDYLARGSPEPIDYARLPFDHPLYILYSSGTTGIPKCIVHGAGGTLLQHLKEHRLHGDVQPGDRLFYFTTCGWMMWNWLVSGLASGATLLLFDGSPFVGRGRILWEYAESERMTHFGTSAKFIDAIKKIELSPRADYDLRAVRTIFSTGSPLSPESFDYVYQHVKDDVCLSSISGGTDIISCFALGCPILPVWRGELQCRGLGMAVDVFDENGRPLRAEKGELVSTAPFPSMPIGFWNDPDGTKYRAAYFERFPGVWCHGDYVELTRHEGMIIHGRSDATLNPGGVRIGTAEIYRQVEQLDEVIESLVIGQDWPPDEAADVRVILFVRLRDGLVLDEDMVDRIKQHIRANTTPRHVPAKVVQVSDIPRTKSGKIVELAVRSVVHGEAVKNADALANPEALEQFRQRPELRA
jgi:acetoacetyl-CoA synthetase